MSDTLTIADAALAWERESSFKTLESSPTWKPFGRNEQLGSIELGEETEELNNWGTRDVEDFEIVGYNPSTSIDMVAANFWFIELAVSQFGSPTGNDPDGDGTNENYTYTTDGSESPVTFEMRVVNNLTGEVYKMVGCRVEEMEIDTSAGTGESGDTVNVSLNIEGAAIVKTQPTTPISEPSALQDALSFDNVKANFGRSSFILTEITFTLTNNASRVKQIRTGSSGGGLTDESYFDGGRQLEISHIEFRDNTVDSELDRLLDSNGELTGTVASADRHDLTLTISNFIGDGAETDETKKNECVFTLNNLFPTGMSWSNWDDKDSAVQEEITDKAVDVTVDYTNPNSSKV